MALSYNLGYQESISVHPTRRQNFAGKVYSNFPNIWEWVVHLICRRTLNIVLWLKFSSWLQGSRIQFSSVRPIKSDWYSFECVYIKFSFLLVIQSTSLAVSRWTYMTNLLWICQFIIGRLDSYMMAGQWPLFYTCVWHFDRLIHRVCT